MRPISLLRELAAAARGARNRRNGTRLLPQLFPARGAGRGVRAPARDRGRHRQAAVPAPARCARGFHRVPRQRARPHLARGRALLHRRARRARRLSRSRLLRRHHGLDLRRAARAASARLRQVDSGRSADDRDRRALSPAARSASEAFASAQRADVSGAYLCGGGGGAGRAMRCDVAAATTATARAFFGI